VCIDLATILSPEDLIKKDSIPRSFEESSRPFEEAEQSVISDYSSTHDMMCDVKIEEEILEFTGLYSSCKSVDYLLRALVNGLNKLSFGSVDFSYHLMKLIKWFTDKVFTTTLTENTHFYESLSGKVSPKCLDDIE